MSGYMTPVGSEMVALSEMRRVRFLFFIINFGSRLTCTLFFFNDFY